MEQERVRQRLINFLASSGIKQNFISFKTGIPTSVISRFKKGRTDMMTSSIETMKSFLTEYGY
jgi:hypothetical protein